MTYVAEVVGGALLGLASAIPFLVDGRVAGISGYASSIFESKSSARNSGLLFVVGIILGSGLWKLLGGHLPGPSDLPIWLWAVAGLLVGFGSRLGGGCTSGHGICGIGRASPRSLAAVLIFVGSAMVVATLVARFL